MEHRKESLMNITIIGTGNMARGIGTRALAGGNDVTLVGHTPDKAKDLAAELQGTATKGVSVQAAPSGAPIGGDLVVLAVPYSAAASVVEQYGD
jgi:predicted dinucleotide-binding enzyme